MQLATVLDLAGVPMRTAVPVVDLLVRLALAKAFFAPGMFAGIAAAELPTSWSMIIVQVIGPALMAIGLWARPVALLMLVLTPAGAVLGCGARRALILGRLVRLVRRAWSRNTVA
jgi:uncharacterized membrane protein YphA (DoxX/SURF4 family)